MGCKSGFKEANVMTKISFFIVLIAMGANWLAFCTNSWMRDNGSYQGLWRSCTVTLCRQLDGTTDIDIGVTQAFAILGFMCLNFGCLVQILFMFWGKFRGNREAGLASAILLIVSGLMWVIAVAVYGGHFDQDGLQGVLHYSFGLAVVAAGLAIIAGLLQFVGSHNGHQISSN